MHFEAVFVGTRTEDGRLFGVLEFMKSMSGVGDQSAVQVTDVRSRVHVEYRRRNETFGMLVPRECGDSSMSSEGQHRPNSSAKTESDNVNAFYSKRIPFWIFEKFQTYLRKDEYVASAPSVRQARDLGISIVVFRSKFDTRKLEKLF